MRTVLVFLFGSGMMTLWHALLWLVAPLVLWLERIHRKGRRPDRPGRDEGRMIALVMTGTLVVLVSFAVAVIFAVRAPWPQDMLRFFWMPVAIVGASMAGFMLTLFAVENAAETRSPFRHWLRLGLAGLLFYAANLTALFIAVGYASV